MQKVDAKRIAGHIQTVKASMEQAVARAGRNPEEITLVAVSKTYSTEAIEAAVAAGITDIGESRVQEGIEKIERLGSITRWHLIGHLQTNKAGKAVRHFNMIQSIDSFSLAEKVSREATKLGKTIDCLMEMNSSGEASKFGFSPEEALCAAERIAGLPGINFRGVMTIGPWTTNEGCVRKAFDVTRRTYEDIRERLGPQIAVLSMGMSADYELAIECGSNMIRVGTAIFGAR